MSEGNGSRVRAVARIDVMLKPEIADPQGQTVSKALPALGWSNVSDVRVGKHLELVVEGASLDALRTQVEEMCERFLANPVIESYEVELVAVGGPGGQSERSERPPGANDQA